MSLKITDTNGFTIGGVINPSITVIYIRPLPNMQKESLVDDGLKTSIQSVSNVTLNGGRYSEKLQVTGISPIYWLKYSNDSVTADEKFLEIDEDLKNKLIEANPEWEGKIEIVSVPN